MSAVLAPPEALPRPEVTDRTSFQAATGASDAVMADLDAFLTLVIEGNAVMNLVGPATIPVFWSRHAWDSAQLLFHAFSAVSVGSGPSSACNFLVSFARTRVYASRMYAASSAVAKHCGSVIDIQCARARYGAGMMPG